MQKISISIIIISSSLEPVESLYPRMSYELRWIIHSPPIHFSRKIQTIHISRCVMMWYEEYLLRCSVQVGRISIHSISPILLMSDRSSMDERPSSIRRKSLHHLMLLLRSLSTLPINHIPIRGYSQQIFSRTLPSILMHHSGLRLQISAALQYFLIIHQEAIADDPL